MNKMVKAQNTWLIPDGVMMFDSSCDEVKLDGVMKIVEWQHLDGWMMHDELWMKMDRAF